MHSVQAPVDREGFGLGEHGCSSLYVTHLQTGQASRGISSVTDCSKELVWPRKGSRRSRTAVTPVCTRFASASAAWAWSRTHTELRDTLGQGREGSAWSQSPLG